jgi:hypothetical protein
MNSITRCPQLISNLNDVIYNSGPDPSIEVALAAQEVVEGGCGEAPIFLLKHHGLPG